MKMKGNFTQVPNNVLEILSLAKLSGTEVCIVLAVCRFTFGWGKEYAQISNGGLGKETGLPRTYCIEILKELRKLNVLTKSNSSSKNRPNYWKVNQDVVEWTVELRDSQLGLTSKLKQTTSSQPETTKSSEPQLTQEINKESKEKVDEIKRKIRERLLK